MAKHILTKQTVPSAPAAGEATLWIDTTTRMLAWIDESGIIQYVDLGGEATPGGRLTLTSNVPVTSADVVGATTVYYTPYMNDRIELWNGFFWQLIQFTQQSLALGTLTSGLPYDVFGFLSSGALALEMLAWSTATARSVNVTQQDGRLCKQTDKTRLYLGTFYTTATTTTEDSVAKRFLFNEYNRQQRRLFIQDATSHTYNVASWRQWNATAADQLAVMVGIYEASLLIDVLASITAAVTGNFGSVSIGLDSTTALAIANTGVTNGNTGIIRGANGIVIPTGLGFHTLTAIEFGNATNAPTFADVTLNGFINA